MPRGLTCATDRTKLLVKSPCETALKSWFWPGGGGGVLPYLGYIGMCRWEGYGFQAVYCRIVYINQNVWV